MIETEEDLQAAVDVEFKRRIHQNPKTWKSQQRLWFSQKTKLQSHIESAFSLRCHTHPLFYRLNGITRESLTEMVTRIVAEKIGPFPPPRKPKDTTHDERNQRTRSRVHPRHGPISD